MNDEARREPQTDEQRARAVLEQLKSVHAFDLAYEMMISLVSFGYQKMGLTDETRPVRDLDDARLAIELLRANLTVIEREKGEEQTRDLHATLAQMQLSYARAVQLAGGERPPAARAETEQPAAQSAAEPAEALRAQQAASAEEKREAGPAEDAREEEAPAGQPSQPAVEPAAKKPAAKPTAKKPAAKPTAKKPTAKKPAAKPTAKKPTAKKPAAKKSSSGRAGSPKKPG